MTDGLDQAMVDVGLALLRADAVLASIVFDGEVPNPRPPRYALIYTTVAWPGDDLDSQSLDAKTSRAIVRWYCHFVGETQAASRALAQRGRTQLIDQRPAIDGMTPGFIREDQSEPPEPVRNEATGITVFDSMHVYRLTVDK